MARQFTQAVDFVNANRLTLESLNQLNSIVDALGGVDGNLTFAASQVTSGTFDNARISESSVTQHTDAVVTTAAVNDAGALMESEVDGDIKTLTLPGNTQISTFAATVLDDTTASDARSTLGVSIGVDVHPFLDINAQTGTTYTLTATDNVVIVTNAGANTVTIPEDLTGGPIWVFQGGAGATTIEGASGLVDLNGTTGGTVALTNAGDKLMLVRRGSNDWIGG